MDLTFIHWPSPRDQVFLAVLLSVRALGLTRQIGISNFTAAQMQQPVAFVGLDVLATNQVEVHHYLQNRQVVAAARELDIPIISYITLAYGTVLDEPVIQVITRRMEVSLARIAGLDRCEWLANPDGIAPRWDC